MGPGKNHRSLGPHTVRTKSAIIEISMNICWWVVVKVIYHWQWYTKKSFSLHPINKNSLKQFSPIFLSVQGGGYEYISIMGVAVGQPFPIKFLGQFEINLLFLKPIISLTFLVCVWSWTYDVCSSFNVPYSSWIVLEAVFRSRSRPEPEPEYLAGAGAVSLARLWLHLKYLFNNSRKLHGT